MADSLSRSAQLLADLIRCPSVTPEEGGALSYLETALDQLGFCVERVTFSDQDTPDVENLYARIGNSGPHLMFAGHTDVVPTGRDSDWSSPPFAAEVENDTMIGRGAVDMKGGIACFLAAVEAFIAKYEKINGSISFLITGDEEGPSINGSDKLLQWAYDKGERWDAAIVGEPSNRASIGDTIKNGRRGSLSGKVIVRGIQGHSAYPHLADNPINGLLDLMAVLIGEPFDAGTDQFQRSNLEITSIDVGNNATNMIPGEALARFNIRFNDLWSENTLKAEILGRLELGANASKLRHGKNNPVDFSVEWVGRVSPVFLTRDEGLIGTLQAAIEAETDRPAELSTGGGTSDARFIKDYCPVVEFGLVGQTMHQIDERVSLADLDSLTAIYSGFLDRYFAAEVNADS